MSRKTSVCLVCNGRCGHFEPGTDRRGGFEWDWEDCPACNGEGVVFNVPMSKVQEDVLDGQEAE